MRTRSFRTLLAAVMVALVSVTAALLLAIGMLFGKRSGIVLVENIMRQTLARVELRVEGVLGQAVTLNDQTLRLVQEATFTPEGWTRLGNFFAKSLEVREGLTALGLALEATGECVLAERRPEGYVRVREYLRNGQGQIEVRDWRLRGNERESLGRPKWDGYDARTRPHYLQARQGRVGGWTETYAFWGEADRPPIVGVTYATPWFAPDGKLVGVLNADFDLNALCAFLARLERELPGYVVVVERRPDSKHRLIAHPRPASLLAADRGQPVEKLTQISDPVVAAYFSSLLQKPPASKTAEYRRLFDVEGEWYLGAFQALSGSNQPPWVLGMVVPRAVVVGEVWRNAAWGGLAAVVLVALAVALAVVLARRIAEPLQELSHEARSIGQLEFETRLFHRTPVREVNVLQGAVAEMKATLRSFRKYVPADVVYNLIRARAEARLGGEQAVLTVLFSDIAGFTSIAESMKPQALVEHLGGYLAALSEIIQAHQGTVDKFIGDGVMAFWGAPQANAAHALDACRAAWRIQERLAELGAQWQARGQPALPTRVGLHTGEVIVGNIGSENRLNYTVMGDTVNVASRMEGLNRDFATRILISETTRAAAGEAIIARPVSRTLVKGRTNGILVFELMGLAAEAPAERRALAERTAAAFAAFEQGELGRARELYAGIRRDFPDDPLARAQLERVSRQ